MAAALAVSPLSRDASHPWLLVAVGAAGVVWLCVGLALRWSAALASAVAVLGAEQAVRLATGPAGVDSWTPLYAAGFVLVAELAWWSIEPRVAAWTEPQVVVRRLAAVFGVSALGGVLSAMVVLAAGAPLEGGVGLELVGVVAATAAVAVVANVAHSRVG
ncbi:MAG: hypothetical protein WBB76_01495 [Gaiellaceae bacterium]